MNYKKVQDGQQWQPAILARPSPFSFLTQKNILPLHLPKSAVLGIWGFGILKDNEIIKVLSLKALSIKNSVEREVFHYCQIENGG